MAELAPEIAHRVAKLNALRDYLQKEIWCVRSATRSALQELSAQKPESVALNVQGILQNRADAVKALCRACDRRDTDAIKHLRTQVDMAAAGTTVEEVLDSYCRFFETDFGRPPNAQERAKLERMAAQACLEMLPLRLAVDRITFAHRNPQHAERAKILECISDAQADAPQPHTEIPARKPA